MVPLPVLLLQNIFIFLRMLCELIGTQDKGETKEFYAIVRENVEGDAVIGSGSSTSVTLAKHVHLLAFSSQNLECCY